MSTYTDNQNQAINFIMNIAAINKPDTKLVTMLVIGFNLDYQDLLHIMPHIIEQCFNGLNRDCGNWAIELNAVIMTEAYR